MGEGVRIAVIAETVWFFESHKVDSVGGEGDKKDFHEEEIECFPAHKEIDIAGEENNKIHLLGFVGETCR